MTRNHATFLQPTKALSWAALKILLSRRMSARLGFELIFHKIKTFVIEREFERINLIFLVERLVERQLVETFFQF